jgi:hypothetical protein
LHNSKKELHVEKFRLGLLASAIVALSTGVHAMEAMDDQSLSDTTGQQGLTITSSLNISGANVVYTDCDGLTTSGTYSKSGDLVVTGFGVTGSVVTTIDVGGDGATGAGSKAILNIGISGTTALTTSFTGGGVISTSNDGTDNPNLGGAAGGTVSNIITLSGTQNLVMSSGYFIDIQLGSGANPFMALSGTLGTVTLGSVATGGGAYTGATHAIEINDVPDGGILGVSGASVSGLVLGTTALPTTVGLCTGATTTAACAAGLGGAGGTAGIEVNVSTAGLTSVNMTVANIVAGSTSSASLGSLYISGMSFAGSKMLIAGH